MPRVGFEKLAAERQGEPSEAIRQRVEAARQLQLARFSGTELRWQLIRVPFHLNFSGGYSKAY